MAGAIRAFDHYIRHGHRGIDVPFGDVERLEDAVGFLWVEQWFELVVLDLDVSRLESFRILVREQQDRLRHVADVALREKWLVLLDEVDDVPTGNVPVVDYGEATRIEIEPDRPDATPRDGRTNGSPVQH